MFRRLTLAALFATFATPLFALCAGDDLRNRFSPAQMSAIDAEIAAMPYNTGIKWEATKGNNTLVIVGSIHAYDDRLQDIFPRLTSEIERAQIVLAEMSTADQAAMQQAIMKNPARLLLPNNGSLMEMVDDATWNELSDALLARGLPPVMGARMQPWYVTLLLASPPCMMSAAQRGLAGLDAMVVAHAEGAGVPVRSLDNWRRVLRIFSDAPVAEQIQILKLSLVGRELENDGLVTMMNRYFEGATAGLWVMSMHMVKLVPELDTPEVAALQAKMQDEILSQRNHAWLPRIRAAARDADNIFMVVGAAHLPGQDGVLNILAQDGWRLAPLD